MSGVAVAMKKARKMLTKDEMGALLAAGKTMREIGRERLGGLPDWVVYELKRVYWPDGLKLADYTKHLKSKPKKEDEHMGERQKQVVAEQPKAQQPEQVTVPEQEQIADTRKMVNINTLVDLHESASKDLGLIYVLLKTTSNISDGVKNALKNHEQQCQQKVDWIDNVFKNTMVELPEGMADGNTTDAAGK